MLTSFLVTDPHNPYNEPLFYAGAGLSVVTPSFGEYYAGQYPDLRHAGVRAGRGRARR